MSSRTAWPAEVIPKISPLKRPLQGPGPECLEQLFDRLADTPAVLVGDRVDLRRDPPYYVIPTARGREPIQHYCES